MIVRDANHLKQAPWIFGELVAGSSTWDFDASVSPLHFSTPRWIRLELKLCH
jgi:hypothetical protein